MSYHTFNKHGISWNETEKHDHIRRAHAQRHVTASNTYATLSFAKNKQIHKQKMEWFAGTFKKVYASTLHTIEQRVNFTDKSVRLIVMVCI